MSERKKIRRLEARLARFEAEHAIRACMNRYMVLCDALDSETPLDELVGLFTRDAIWEGVGDKYRASFGRIEGREALRAMFAKYMTVPPHFLLNVHFMTTELIEVQDADRAIGSWVMLQTSTFASGASHLNAARLSVDFRRVKGHWQMAHFRTQNLFSRPIDAWNQAEPLPVPR